MAKGYPSRNQHASPPTAEVVEATKQYLSSVERNMALLAAAQIDYDTQNFLDARRVEELASYGVPARNICALFGKEFMAINNDPELWAAFNKGRAGIGAKVRASIVDQALEKESLTAMIHLDKVFNNDQQAQQVELSVKNDILNDVPTEDLINIMYNKAQDE